MASSLLIFIVPLSVGVVSSQFVLLAHGIFFPLYCAVVELRDGAFKVALKDFPGHKLYD